MLQQNLENRSVGELLGDLTREVSTLVREEINLAKSEVTQKAAQASKNIVFIAIGGVLAFAGLLFLLESAVSAISLAMPRWGAALIVGLVVVAVAGALIMKGINALKGQNLTPERTVRTLKEDAQWAKTQLQ